MFICYEVVSCDSFESKKIMCCRTHNNAPQDIFATTFDKRQTEEKFFESINDDALASHLLAMRNL